MSWRVVELWKLPAESFLAEGDIGVVPWVPLMKMTSEPEGVLEHCVERIEHEAPPSQQSDMLAVTAVMASLTFRGSDYLRFFQGKQPMIESPVVKRWQAEAVHKIILAILKKRFKTVPRDVTKHLQQVQDEAKLTRLAVAAGECSSVDAFRETLAT